MLFTKRFLIIFFLLIGFYSFELRAQQIVPVYKEPRHQQVFLNQYVRVINAFIEDGDTSLYHIHASPSAFVMVREVSYRNQVLGKDWTTMSFKQGQSWFSSFSEGPATHRVGAPKGVSLHAFDVEILGGYEKGNPTAWKPLTQDTSFVNSACAGYRIELTKENPVFSFSPRGPMVAVLIKGELIQISQPDTRVHVDVEAENYGYIHPGFSGKISLKEGESASMVVFEVR